MAGPKGASGVPASARLPGIQAALTQLAQAYVYAEDAQHDVWDLAVEIDLLHGLGVTPSDLRWLVCKGYVKHAREVTQPGDDARAFRPTGALTFPPGSCCVLTADGLQFLRHLGENGRPHDGEHLHFTLPPVSEVDQNSNGRRALRFDVPVWRPVWDVVRRELRVARRLVKRFRWRAPNQETLLAVFEEEGWPPRLDDPLPRLPEQDPRRRLHDTIKCLNRNQEHPLLRFHGDGSGEGVSWELVGALRTWHVDR